ncbi:MAG: TonB family protein [Candidatus Omnitrophota bacterium]
MKRYRFIIFFAAIFLLFSPLKDYALDDTGEELKLYLGQPKVIAVNSPSRIVVGNPEIVDVANVTSGEMTLAPKAAGKTTLVFWDNFGEQAYTVKVFSEDIFEVKRRIDNMLSKLNLPEVFTQAEEEEGKVIILGRVKTIQEHDKILLALGPLKDKALDLVEVREEEAVVEIDVEVLELDKDATNTLGLTWPGAVNLLEVGSRGIGPAGSKFSNLFTLDYFQRATFSSGAATADPFTFKLDALVQEGKARILSRPKLACQSGKEAELLVGGEKPVFTTSVASTAGTSTEVEYKEFGIKLKIKPTVTAEERIKLALNVEVSEVGTAEFIGTTTNRTAQAYPLSKRAASTELFLNDGQTMAIGGLMKQKSAEDIRKVPWLGDVPVLGMFFRKKTSTTGGGQGERGDTELFIMLTTKIVSQRQSMAKAPEKQVVELKALEPELSASVAGPKAGYAQIIQKRILEQLSYPSAARQAGFQGTAKLTLRLSYKGELLDAVVKDSSGYEILDSDALATAKTVVSYPPFPSSIEEKELQIDIPIDYRLD